MVKLTLAQIVDQFLHGPKHREEFGVNRVEVIANSNLQWVIPEQTLKNGPYQLRNYLLAQLKVVPNYSSCGVNHYRYTSINQENSQDSALFEVRYLKGLGFQVSNPENPESELDFSSIK